MCTSWEDVGECIRLSGGPGKAAMRKEDGIREKISSPENENMS